MRRSILTAMWVAIGLMLGAATVPHQSDGWEFRRDTPDALSCRAVKRGATVNIQLVRNRDNQLVLVAGHPDWSNGTDPFPVRLTIDGGAPVTLSGLPLGRVVFMRIENDAVLQRLKGARTLDLSMGGRQFRADIAGLGAAFDAIAICPG